MAPNINQNVVITMRIYIERMLNKEQGAMTEQRRKPDSTQRGGSNTTPLNLPSTSPHISGKVVPLSLSDNDQNLVFAEVQRLEVVSLAAHMEGSRPNRPELH